MTHTEIKSFFRNHEDRRHPFSPLLELLMVILILEILFLLAIPVYRTTILKAAFSEVISIQRIGRIEVQEYYAITGKWLSGTGEVENESDLQGYTQEIKNGVAMYNLPKRLSTRLSGNWISFYPTGSGNDTMSIQWHCGYLDADLGSDATANKKTKIPQQYLLNICKQPNKK